MEYRQLWKIGFVLSNPHPPLVSTSEREGIKSLTRLIELFEWIGVLIHRTFLTKTSFFSIWTRALPLQTCFFTCKLQFHNPFILSSLIPVRILQNGYKPRRVYRRTTGFIGLVSPFVTLKPSALPSLSGLSFANQLLPQCCLMPTFYLPLFQTKESISYSHEGLSFGLSLGVLGFHRRRGIPSAIFLEDLPLASSRLGIGYMTLHFESICRHFIKSWCCAGLWGLIADLRQVLMFRINRNAEIGSFPYLKWTSA